MTSVTLTHIMEMVLPAAEEYLAAERRLTQAFHERPTSLDREAAEVRRQAGNCAVAIDGLRDRAAREFAIKKPEIGALIDALCVVPGTAVRRPCIDRVRAVAAALRHDHLDDRTLCITTFDDVSAGGAGYGIDGFGLGKHSAPEAVVLTKDGTAKKLLADIPTAIHAWFRFLEQHGVDAPKGPTMVCNLDVSPRAPGADVS